MKNIMRVMIGCLIAGILLAEAGCGMGASGKETETTTPSATDIELVIPNVEICAFDQVRFDGECHTDEQLEDYLAYHLADLLVDMSAHGITVDEYTEISSTPIHILNLITGSVGLHAHFLPVLERGALVNAVSVNVKNEELTVSAAVSWPWMSQVDRVLKEHPQESYLLGNCLIEGGNYICLISSQNEIIYVVRPTNGGDLPFEEGVDYYGKLYDDRIAISHTKIYGG